MKHSFLLTVFGVATALHATCGYAQELKVDLGNFPAPPCMSSSGQKASQSGQSYRARSVRVTARIFIDPSDPGTLAAIETCANRAKQELSGSKSFSNLRLFEETFQDYLSQCARQADVGVREVRSFLSSNATCQGEG